MNIQELRDKLNDRQSTMSGAQIYDMGRTEVVDLLDSIGAEVYATPKKTYVHVDGIDYAAETSWVDEYTPRIVLIDVEEVYYRAKYGN